MKITYKDLANFFGLELDEECNATWLGIVQHNKLKITRDGIIDSKGNIRNELLHGLLSGDIELQKIWKPKYSEHYFMPHLEIGTFESAWSNCGADRDRYEKGLVFRTKEEAIEAYNKMMKTLE